MRILLFLLLISCELFGQQELFHAQNKGLLLDEYPNAAAAYSLRRVNSRYTGALIRVRRDSTGQAEQDIGSIGEALDTVALKAFIRNNSGYVTTWYDQSGNARNATQTTAANQPRIVNAGVVDKLNGKPAMYFDGSNDFLGTATVTNWTFLHYSTAYTNFTVARAGIVTDPEAAYILWGTCISNFNIGASLSHDTRNTIPSNNALRHGMRNGSGTAVSDNKQNDNSTSANTQFLATVIGKPLNATAAERSAIGTNANALQKNNTLITQNAINANALHPLRFGTSEISGANSFFLLGNIQESIFYQTDQTANLPVFRNNINSYYAIY